MSEHTKGRLETRWALKGFDVAIVAPSVICPADSLPVIIAECFAAIRHRTESAASECAANARRLVACWNWCDGISTEFMESRINPFSNTQLDLERDCAELIAALRGFEAAVTKLHIGMDQIVPGCEMCARVTEARALLARLAPEEKA